MLLKRHLWWINKACCWICEEWLTMFVVESVRNNMSAGTFFEEYVCWLSARNLVSIKMHLTLLCYIATAVRKQWDHCCFKTCICSLFCYEECVGQERKERGSVEVAGRYFMPNWLGGGGRRGDYYCLTRGKFNGRRWVYAIPTHRHKLPPPLKEHVRLGGTV